MWANVGEHAGGRAANPYGDFRPVSGSGKKILTGCIYTRKRPFLPLCTVYKLKWPTFRKA
jgi:hypothetical protein